MKITVENKKDLLEALGKVQGVVEKRNTLQILTNLYLQVSQGQLTIKATDLEISMETSVPVTMEAPGTVTVSAKSFFEIVKELPDKEIKISAKENHWIAITCGSSKFNIMGIAPEDYPALPAFSRSTFVKVNPTKLRHMIDNTIFAISTDETRYHLNGVFLDQAEGNRQRMVATDGHRLAYVETELFAEPQGILGKGIIIPRKGVQELKKLLDTGIDSPEISLEGNHLILKAGPTYLFIRLIEGRFPDYKQVIPKNNPFVITLDTRELLLSLKRVSLLANEKSKGIKVSAREDKVEISTNNPEIGEAKESLDAAYRGDLIEIGFNAKYLMEAISGITEEKVELALNDRMSPGIVRKEGDSSYLCVLMPMRL